MKTASQALLLAGACLLFPCEAAAQATVLIDQIPSGAKIVNFGTLPLPIADLGQVAVAQVESGLGALLEQTQKLGAQTSASYICLLSAPGDDFREYHVGGADKTLRLTRLNPSLNVVLFKDGSEAPAAPAYRLGASTAEPHVTFTIKKVSLPPGWNSALWLFFNLTRLQTDAVKSGASEIYLTASGTGPTATVALPGMKEPFTIFNDDMTIAVSWKTSYAPAEGSAPR